MKKCILVFAVLCLTAATASAQMIRFGIKGGVSMLTTDIGGKEGGKIQNLKSDIGYSFGVISRINIPLTNLYVQPELIYNYAKYSFDNSHSSLKFNNIELPVLLGFKILFLRANVGPTFTVATMSDGDLYTIKRPEVGFQAGLGFMISMLSFDVRYHGYFNKAWSDVNFDDISGKIKANDGYWGISVGYFF